MPLKAIEALLENKIGLSAAAIGAHTVTKAVNRRRCICGLQDVAAYRACLETNKNEWEKLIEEIVVPETWFFRHIQSFQFFSQHVLSELKPHLNKRLRILSIPCATGEEPYSLAMMLINAGIPCERFQIDALDISLQALRKALRGLYSPASFRGRDNMPTFQASYFKQIDGSFQLHSEVMETVCFNQGNLLDNNILADQPCYDIIFCRNLMIYFSASARKRTRAIINRLLKNSGLLFVGHSERVAFKTPGFNLIDVRGVFAYRKTAI